MGSIVGPYSPIPCTYSPVRRLLIVLFTVQYLVLVLLSFSFPFSFYSLRFSPHVKSLIYLWVSLFDHFTRAMRF